MNFMPFPGYNPSPQAEEEQLPCGAYVGRIEKAATDMTKNGSKYLGLTLEIIEGPYTGWFAKDLAQHSGGMYPAKHKGSFKLFHPRGLGGWQDKKNVDQFNAAIYAIQASNPGFDWDGNDAALVGKRVGFIVREAEWNGYVFVEIGKLIPVNNVYSGRFTLMPRRGSKQSDSSQNEPVTNEPDDSRSNNGLPF